MFKIKPDKLTAGIVKSSFKKANKNFVASDEFFLFVSYNFFYMKKQL